MGSSGAPTGSHIDFDVILSYIGQCRRWQWTNFFLLWLTSAAGGLAVVVWAFTAMTPDARCIIPYCDSPGSSLEYSKPPFFMSAYPDAAGTTCSYPSVNTLTTTDGCDNYLSKLAEARNNSVELDYITCDRKKDLLIDTSVVRTSLTVDYDFVCNGEIENKGVLGATYMLGMLLGSFLLGLVSDAIGRVKALMLSVILAAVSGFIGAFMPEPFGFGFFRVLTGMGGIGLFMITFVLAVEYVGVKFTMLIGIAIEIPFALGEMVLGLEAYYIRDWQTLQIVAYLPLLVLLLLYFLLPESPRWLLAKGRTEEALEIIKKAAHINGRTIPEDVLTEKTEEELKTDDNLEIQERAGTKHASFFDIFRPSDIAVRSINMFYQWFSVTVCYYGLSFASTSLAGSPYTNFFLSVLVEIPGYFFCIFVMDCWGRRPILSFCQGISGLACIIAGLMSGIPELLELQVFLTLLGKFGASACFAIVYVYTAELFPTIIRNTAIGSCSTMARVGGILALLLANVQGSFPFIIMGAIAVVAGGLAILFPETVGHPLPETMEEARNIGKHNKRGLLTCVCPKDIKSHFSD